jgi:hypothetical protein
LARPKHGENHTEYAIAIAWLVYVCEIQGSYAEAEPHYNRTLTIHEKALGRRQRSNRFWRLGYQSNVSVTAYSTGFSSGPECSIAFTCDDSKAQLQLLRSSDDRRTRWGRASRPVRAGPMRFGSARLKRRVSASHHAADRLGAARLSVIRGSWKSLRTEI